MPQDVRLPLSRVTPLMWREHLRLKAREIPGPSKHRSVVSRVCTWDLTSQSPSAGYPSLPAFSCPLGMGLPSHQDVLGTGQQQPTVHCGPAGEGQGCTAPQASYCSEPGRGLLVAVTKQGGKEARWVGRHHEWHESEQPDKGKT